MTTAADLRGQRGAARILSWAWEQQATISYRRNGRVTVRARGKTRTRQNVREAVVAVTEAAGCLAP